MFRVQRVGSDGAHAITYINRVYTYIHMYMYIYVKICTFMYILVSIYRQTHLHTDLIPPRYVLDSRLAGAPVAGQGVPSTLWKHRI